MSKEKQINNVDYLIKIPVYTTRWFDRKDELFPKMDYNDMCNTISEKIANFNIKTNQIHKSTKNKTKQSVIRGLKCSQHKIGDVDCVLIQISSYTTNIYGSYYEGDSTIPIEKNHKISNENNFFLMYPIINGLTNSDYTCSYIILIYDDPTKDSGEIVKLTKTVLSDILEIPIQNIKIKQVLEEIAAHRFLPELQIKYSSFENTSDDVNTELRQYVQKISIKKDRLETYKDIPNPLVSKILFKTNDEDEYQVKVSRLIVGKKEYKITRKMKDKLEEAEDELNNLAEKIFNESVYITGDDLEQRLHDKDFMLQKFSDVLTNYLSNDV